MEGRADNGAAFATMQHVSLGGSEFKVIHKDSLSKSDEEGLLNYLYKDDENKGINMEIGRVHKTAGQHEALQGSSEDDKNERESSRSSTCQDLNGGSSTQGKLGDDTCMEPNDAARGALALSLKRASLAANEAMQGTGEALSYTAEEGPGVRMVGRRKGHTRHLRAQQRAQQFRNNITTLNRTFKAPDQQQQQQTTLQYKEVLAGIRYTTGNRNMTGTVGAAEVSEEEQGEEEYNSDMEQSQRGRAELEAQQ